MYGSRPVDASASDAPFALQPVVAGVCDGAADYPLPRRMLRWPGIIFFTGLHAVAIIGTPLYIYYRGIGMDG